ncbi:MAG: TIGR03000 domain-containing protein [Pirellulales bacterium]
MGFRKTLLGAVVAVSAFAAATDADAFWGSRGSWGSYGGSWGSSGGSWGSSGGSWGSSGGSYGSGGSWGSSGSSGGSHGGWFRRHWARHGSSGGSWGSSGGSSGSSGGSYGSSGSTGGQASYGYTDGGYAAVQGSAPTVAAVKTTLKLNVPTDAKVTLAGVPTKQSGEMREFATNKLAAGQTWSNYNVHVEVTKDGKTYSQDRTILLTGGQSQELSFDLGGMQLASKN